MTSLSPFVPNPNPALPLPRDIHSVSNPSHTLPLPYSSSALSYPSYGPLVRSPAPLHSVSAAPTLPENTPSSLASPLAAVYPNTPVGFSVSINGSAGAAAVGTTSHYADANSAGPGSRASPPLTTSRQKISFSLRSTASTSTSTSTSHISAHTRVALTTALAVSDKRCHAQLLCRHLLSSSPSPLSASVVSSTKRRLLSGSAPFKSQPVRHSNSLAVNASSSASVDPNQNQRERERDRDRERDFPLFMLAHDLAASRIFPPQLPPPGKRLFNAAELYAFIQSHDVHMAPQMASKLNPRNVRLFFSSVCLCWCSVRASVSHFVLVLSSSDHIYEPPLMRFLSVSSLSWVSQSLETRVKQELLRSTMIGRGICYRLHQSSLGSLLCMSVLVL